MSLRLGLLLMRWSWLILILKDDGCKCGDWWNCGGRDYKQIFNICSALTTVRNCSKHFIDTISLNPYNNPTREVLLACPFYRRVNCSPTSHSSKVLDVGCDTKQADSIPVLLGPTLCCWPDWIERENTSEDGQCLEQMSGRGVSRHQKGAVKRRHWKEVQRGCGQDDG